MRKSLFVALAVTNNLVRRLLSKISTIIMKPTTLIAVAGGMLINTLSLKHDKKHDVFFRADMKYQEKKCPDAEKSCKAKSWRSCRGIV
jgi:hypothetical protein